MRVLYALYHASRPRCCAAWCAVSRFQAAIDPRLSQYETVMPDVEWRLNVGGAMMNILLSELEKMAVALPADERARLVDVLLQSLQAAPIAEVEAAWSEEIANRLAAFERGELNVFAAESVFAEARLLAK
jgi:putative addiction module component (TIGR02574 family)